MLLTATEKAMPNKTKLFITIKNVTLQVYDEI
jgi:hypothetical protein